MYQATVAVYRSLNESKVFKRVSDVVTISKLRPSRDVHPDDALQSGFNCDSYNLTSIVDMQVGDVIGACIFDPTLKSGRRLNLVATNRDGGYKMLYKDRDTVDCDTDVLPEVVTDLSMDQDLKILHVYAQIGKNKSNISLVPRLSRGWVYVQIYSIWLKSNKHTL